MSAWSKLRDFAVLMRLHNCLLAAASVLIGSFLARSALDAVTALGACVAFLIAAGGYALNDAYDIETDRINRPLRPLPSGRIGARAAYGFSLVIWAAGLGLSLAAGPPAVVFALSCMLLLWLYSRRLKSAGLAGHILVSLLSSSGFILGSVLGGNAVAGAVPFCVAFVFHFAREVVKGAVDLRGDVRTGIRTLPARMGERKCALLSITSIAAAMIVSIFPYAADFYGILYLLPVLAVQPLLALSIYLIAASRAEGPMTARTYGRVAGILKAVMPVGLLAFFLGGM